VGQEDITWNTKKWCNARTLNVLQIF